MPSQPSRKAPNLWAIASVTYGAVILVTILSIVGYYYASPKFLESQSGDSARRVTVGSVWMPLYPGATIASTASAPRDAGTESTLNFESKEQANKVLSFYESKLKEAGLKVDSYTAAANGQQTGGTLTGTSESPKREVSVLVSSSGSQTQAIITVQEKK